MKKEITEETLTAYVLGELGERQHAEVEKLLKDSKEAQTFVEETKAISKIAQSASKASSADATLAEEQKAAIIDDSMRKRVHGSQKARRPWRFLKNTLAAAAVLTVLATLAVPNVARYSGMSANEGSAVGGVRTLSSGEAEYDVYISDADYDAYDPTYYDTWGPGGCQICDGFFPGPPPPGWLAERARRQRNPGQSSRYHYEDDGANANAFDESYDTVRDNPFRQVTQAPLSTFSIDVDTASYANMRRFLTQRQRPPANSVRIEEFINYFKYDYVPPRDAAPFTANVEVASAPWRPEHRLVRIGLKGREIAKADRPASNLVFLIDVSGSMQSQNKLPLVKQGIKLLTRQLDERDSVAMVVYAGSSGLALPATNGNNQHPILEAIDRLEAGGSTNGGAGIQLAYDTAVANFIEGGVNRVILCTDGDFNVGTTDRGSLTNLIEAKRRSGVFLSVLGFGMGNLKDGTLENLADKGNGNYAYIDNFREARKVFVQDIMSTLVTIAKDVKIQVEFNPSQVAAYRLIGYENRMLAAKDFNDDTKDAGEIGAGHTVTALYEIVPVGLGINAPGVDNLRYQTNPPVASAPIQGEASGELFTLKLRYKQPDGNISKKIEFYIHDSEQSFEDASADYKFASAVAAFGMVLRESPHANNASLRMVLELAEDGLGKDKQGYRAEFIDLVRKAEELTYN